MGTTQTENSRTLRAVINPLPVLDGLFVPMQTNSSAVELWPAARSLPGLQLGVPPSTTTKQDPASNSAGLVTKEELAVRFNVSKRTVDNWRAKGLIPEVKIGKLVRFSIAECEEALRRFRRGSRWERR